MSRNFELLQNIGKEKDYFQSESALPEVTASFRAPLTESVSAEARATDPRITDPRSAAAAAPAQSPVVAGEPSQFSMESSQMAELAKLVQRLFLLPGGESHRTVVFTGSDSGDGCSWICARVGELLASQVAGSVCLVDANLQSPTLHEQFGVPNHHGLADALRQNGSMRGYVSQLSRRNLALVSCGSDAKDAQGLIASDRMRMRLNELRSEFEYVLIDCSSMSVNNQAIALGSAADGVVLVLKANSSRKDRARGAVQELKNARVKVLGAVLNQRTYPIPDSVYNKL